MNSHTDFRMQILFEVNIQNIRSTQSKHFTCIVQVTTDMDVIIIYLRKDQQDLKANN